MALPKIQDVRELSNEQVASQIIDIKKRLFQLRLKRATQQQVKPHEFRHAKHRLSQLLTVERERQSKSV
ncbi:MAG: 50S ribosomal protein L29 [Oscillatoriales cyanobacterium SM2_2_1]|nr:50S ribosomal protein L29 [Oscillatoriales cyanobacterium SM2_2_1]